MAWRWAVGSPNAEPTRVPSGNRFLAAICHGDRGVRGGAAVSEWSALPAYLFKSQR